MWVSILNLSLGCMVKFARTFVRCRSFVVSTPSSRSLVADT